MSERPERNIALTGFMAVGKTAVGRRLARKLGRPFVDLDQVIELKEGLKVREIFDRKGEVYFRRLEKQALKEVLAQDGQVIATGGGAITDEENLGLLKRRSLLICLMAAPEVLLQRSGRAAGRPLLRGDDRKKRIEGLLRQREGQYARAHLTIDTSGLTADKVAEKILEAIGDLTEPSPSPSPSGRGRG